MRGSLFSPFVGLVFARGLFIPEGKISVLLPPIGEVSSSRLVTARLLAQVTGRIISCKLVFGHIYKNEHFILLMIAEHIGIPGFLLLNLFLSYFIGVLMLEHSILDLWSIQLMFLVTLYIPTLAKLLALLIFVLRSRSFSKTDVYRDGSSVL